MKTHLGHYEIVAELGRGGMGVVYKGYEPSLARFVAIKELSPMLAHDSMVVERFLREARSMALLNDPHIIQIYSIGQENDQPFFVMEFVDGESVAELIKRDGHLQAEDALKIVHQTAKGLSTAHERGVIHRDVKPANLMLSQRGQIKIADFGIALANQDISAKLTSAGEMVGTPGYLPPEILLGNPVDQRSDIYALGVALFEMLTGRTPFSDASVYKLMLDVMHTEVPDVREINAEIDPGVAAILAKMLIKDPAKRYQDMRELITDLEKHPLISRGGQIKTRLAPAPSSASTTLGLAMPMTPGVGQRLPTAPPEMGRRDPLVTPVISGAAATPVFGQDTQVRTKPGVGEPAAAASAATVATAAPTVAKRSNAILFLMLGLLVILLGSAWVFRAVVFAPATPDSGSGVAVQGQTSAEGAPAVAWYAPYKQTLVNNFLESRKMAISELDPLLKQLGVKVSPVLVFNLLMLLVVVIIYQTIAGKISRMRARRAYEKRSRRKVV